jgi:hypothetical protein
MTFIVASCALLLALLGGIVLDELCGGGGQDARRDVPDGFDLR